MTNDRDVSDVDYEPEDEVGTVGAMKAKLEKLKGELEHAKAERQEYLDGWQRCKADSINTRKETEARASRSAETLREALVHDIIPALDSFDMATSSEAWSAVSDGFRSGMEQVQGQLLSALKNHSIERFGRSEKRSITRCMKSSRSLMTCRASQGPSRASFAMVIELARVYCGRPRST